MIPCSSAFDQSHAVTKTPSCGDDVKICGARLGYVAVIDEENVVIDFRLASVLRSDE